jgi:hypothetical protein
VVVLLIVVLHLAILSFFGDGASTPFFNFFLGAQKVSLVSQFLHFVSSYQAQKAVPPQETPRRCFGKEETAPASFVGPPVLGAGVVVVGRVTIAWLLLLTSAIAITALNAAI